MVDKVIAPKTISSKDDKEPLKPWQIALIVIGSVLATLLIIGLIWLILYKSGESDYEVITYEGLINLPDKSSWYYNKDVGLKRGAHGEYVDPKVLRTLGGEDVVIYKENSPGILDADGNFIGYDELLRYKIVDDNDGFPGVYKDDKFMGFQEYLENLRKQ